VFWALADPHRVKLVNLMATSPDPVWVCEFIHPQAARLSQPTVSYHAHLQPPTSAVQRP
jgi:hypothetical protein